MPFGDGPEDLDFPIEEPELKKESDSEDESIDREEEAFLASQRVS